MKRFAVLTCVLAVLAAGVAQAQDDRRPPRAVLKQPELRQEGRLGSYCWSWTDESGSGGAQCVDYFRHVWPRSKAARKATPARITLKYPDAPSDGSLRYWRKVDEDKQPVGEGTDLPYVITPRQTDNGTVWDLAFDLPGYRGRFYLSGFFAWEGKGDGSYHWRLMLD